MQAFPVRLRSGAVYWTVLDDALGVVAAADTYLQQLRFGRDAAESTTKSCAGALALYLGWCAGTGQPWTSAERLGWFMTWLQHTPADPARPVVTGPGVRPVRRERTEELEAARLTNRELMGELNGLAVRRSGGAGGIAT